MLVVRFCGGLGNQLFQYALYLKLLSIGKEVYADLSAYNDGIEKRYFYLSKLSISLRELSSFQKRLLCPGTSAFYIINKHFRGLKYYPEEEYYSFDRGVFDTDRVYLDGYWQNPRYFDDIKQTIVGSIHFPHLPAEQMEIMKKMISENSVFVHVRMGDYLSNQELYGGICTKEYYGMAFEEMDQIENPRYYGFSDNVELAKVLLGRDDIYWVNCNSEKDAYYDLFLMSSCKNAIISNSSFSWWGAYLNMNEKAVIVAPGKWMNGINDCGIWCDNWTRVMV